MTKARAARYLGTFVVILALMMLTNVSRSAADSTRTIKIFDKCDPATFNAAIGPGTCVGSGDVTFGEFIAELTKERSVDDWEFDPDETEIARGQAITARNFGGEAHTFTAVRAFGGGFVPFLNDLAGTPVPAPECVTFPAVFGTIVPPGRSSQPIILGKGVHEFQCCIHPWMRTTIVVE